MKETTHTAPAASPLKLQDQTKHADQTGQTCQIPLAKEANPPDPSCTIPTACSLPAAGLKADPPAQPPSLPGIEKRAVTSQVQVNTVYTDEEAFAAALGYFDGDELAARVWINKYALKDGLGHLYEKTPDDMHHRIASELASIERQYPNAISAEDIYQLIKGFKYLIPQGGPMTGIGNPYQIASLSNCFVIGSETNADSYGAILTTDQEQVQLMKRRGGVGHDLSFIRPKGSPVKNSALTSTGIVPFMERYSNSTREVAQDGRRGALMLSVSIHHPDAADFIDAKSVPGKITGANVSVRITDAFMQAVKNAGQFTQQFPVESKHPIYTKQTEAVALWQKIIHNAWQSAEPGILFWDTILKESIPDCYSDLGFKTLSTNPCGEIPLCAYDSCRLLAINLYSYVDQPFTANAVFNKKLFKDHVMIAQKLMDDIIDLELEKIDSIINKIEQDPETYAVKSIELNLWRQIRQKARQGRRTGLGITAEGDLLAALGLRYGSEQSIEFLTELHKELAINAYRSSVQLARERGAFPIYDSTRETENPFISRLKKEDPDLVADMGRYGRRNIALLTIAPTGTTSLMAQTTSGIEPVFMPVYKRRRKVNPNDQNARIDFRDESGDSWEEYTIFHRQFKKWMQVSGQDLHKVYTGQELDSLVAASPYYKATSNDVDYKAKVRLQGAIQKWVDHSISVTINMAHDVSEALVGELYMEAWKSGCKGVTVYRDGCRTGVLVAPDDTKTAEPVKAPLGDKKSVEFPVERPEVLKAEVVRFQNNKEKWIAFIGLIDQRPYEIFTGIANDDDGILLPKWVTEGKILKTRLPQSGSRYDFQYENLKGFKTTIEGLSQKFNPEFWNYAKLISAMLRHGIAIEKVVDLVNGLQLQQENINTWKNGVARALRHFIADDTWFTKAVCSNCGGHHLSYQEGCLVCKDCGHSKCE